MEKQRRSFRPYEIAEIITETVQATEKDLYYLGKVVKMIATLTVNVVTALEDDRESGVERVQSRSMKEDAQVWKCLVALKERRK